MHSSVFEISHAPVPAAKRTRAGNLPDWFYEQICDYAENTDLVQRQDAISQFCRALGGLCAPDGNRLTVSPHIRESYFRKSYRCFITAAETLAQTDYETFSGIYTGITLSLNLDKLNSSYEDRRGVYVYLTDTGDLMTLNHWLRAADFSKPLYIGGTINYYY